MSLDLYLQHESRYTEKVRECNRLREELEALRSSIHSPEIEDFLLGVKKEVLHQRERWGEQHDAGKGVTDWYWLLGYLGGKALHAAISRDWDKVRHHLITTAAACYHWHESLSDENRQELVSK